MQWLTSLQYIYNLIAINMTCNSSESDDLCFTCNEILHSFYLGLSVLRFHILTVPLHSQGNDCHYSNMSISEVYHKNTTLASHPSFSPVSHIPNHLRKLTRKLNHNRQPPCVTDWITRVMVGKWPTKNILLLLVRLDTLGISLNHPHKGGISQLWIRPAAVHTTALTAHLMALSSFLIHLFKFRAILFLQSNHVSGNISHCISIFF